jgi:hypothetical protein
VRKAITAKIRLVHVETPGNVIAYGNTSAFSDPLMTGCWHLALPVVMKAYSGL